MTRLDRLTERLDLKEFQLRALLEVTRAINANVERQALLDLFRDIVSNELGITRLMLFERVEGWECVLSYGASERDRAIDVEQAFGSFPDIRLIGPEQEQRMAGFDIAVPVFHNDRAIAFLLIGDIDDEEQKMSPSVKHLNFIQTLTNIIMVALENKRIAEQALLRERDKRELELAAEMQSMLVPKELPDEELFRAAAWYLPHHQVGGDHYDIIERGDEKVLVIADVSGKGMAAALVMSNFQATLRALVQYSEDPLDELVHDLNDKVYQSARGERFITLFIAQLNVRTGAMRFVNAGHNPPLLYDGRSVHELKTGSIALGMMPKLPFLQVGEVSLSKGSTMLCYTDGLIEQEDVHGTDLGTEPLVHALKDLHISGPAAVNEGIIATFEAHRSTQPYLDDIALLTCQLR
ncbi:MAG: PP2C family protein-serine/threonine phosphatase [Flavobacteriales bacterium]|nr:PP2C family protein-serine/threonine phosphatase [Flavobacteriales bacterium]